MQTLGAERRVPRFSELFEPRLLKILGLGVFIAVFQQWCGINVIFNYAEEIFRAAGYDVSGMMVNVVITGLVNLGFLLRDDACADCLGLDFGNIPQPHSGGGGQPCGFLALDRLFRVDHFLEADQHRAGRGGHLLAVRRDLSGRIPRDAEVCAGDQRPHARKSPVARYNLGHLSGVFRKVAT